MWPKYSDGTDINATCRSKKGDAIVTGDDFGMVKLFAYPCPEGSTGKEYRGHSAHVTNVRFNHDNEYLISIGGGDTAIFQWKYVEEGGHKAETQMEEIEEQLDEVGEEYDSDLEKEKNINYEKKKHREEKRKEDQAAEDKKDKSNIPGDLSLEFV